MQSLSEFSTVEDFWKVYNNVPKPSQVSEASARLRPPASPLLYIVCRLMARKTETKVNPGRFSTTLALSTPITTETQA